VGTASPLIILDGLLGVGARPPLREPIRAACRSINQLRANKGAYVLPLIFPPVSIATLAKRSRLRNR